MLYFPYCVLLVLFILAFLLYVISYRRGNRFSRQKEGPSISKKLQMAHFKIYLLILFVEWLQGPYLFRLYADYCIFSENQIAILYIIGIVFTPILIPFVSILSERGGSLFSTLLLLMILSLSLLMKISKSFNIQLISRILAVISTPNLLTCVDDWYALEISKAKLDRTIDVDSNRIAKILQNVFQFSVSGISILAGILSDCVAEWLNRGYSAPYLAALLPILYTTYIIIRYRLSTPNQKFMSPTFDEMNIDGLINEECLCGSTLYHTRNIKCYYVGFVETFHSIYYNKRFSLLFSSILQSLIDCTIYVFIFSWTPLLEYSAKHTSSIGLVYFPLGAIFSCFMAGIMIGGLLFKIISSYSVSPTKMLITIPLSIAAFNFLLSNYSPIHRNINPQACLIILVCIEILYGMYTPYVQWLRQNCTPIDFANNKFSMYVVDCAVRIPMNLIIIFFIFIPLMPKQLDLEAESVNSGTSDSYRFHLMNPANLFLASSLLALLAIIPAKILHDILPRDFNHYGRSLSIATGASII